MRFRISIAVSVALLACASEGRAQIYSFQYYGVDQGLTDLAVRTIYQDARGFLWLSTENGVFRYDGERFQAIGQAEGLPPSNAAMFGEAPDGSLLAGGKFGLYRMPGASGRFEAVAMPGATGVMWGSGIESDGRGTTYIATDAGLMAMTKAAGTLPLRIRLMDSPPHTGGATAFGVLATDDSVWWGCGDEICLSRLGKTSVFGRGAGLPAGAWRDILIVHGGAHEGDIWVQRSGDQVAVLRKGKTRFEMVDLTKLSGFGPRGLISVDAEGHVIIPIGDGVAIERNGEWHMAGRAAGIHGPVYATLQDREGSVWLGLAGHGLAKWLGYGEWEHFNSDNGLGSDLVYEAAPSAGGGLWIGTDSGLFLGTPRAEGWSWKRQDARGRHADTQHSSQRTRQIVAGDRGQGRGTSGYCDGQSGMVWRSAGADGGEPLRDSAGSGKPNLGGLADRTVCRRCADAAVPASGGVTRFDALRGGGGGEERRHLGRNIGRIVPVTWRRGERQAGRQLEPAHYRAGAEQ